jgi:hypothetical protein
VDSAPLRFHLGRRAVSFAPENMPHTVNTGVTIMGGNMERHDDYDHEQFALLLKDIKEQTERITEKVEAILDKFYEELDELQQ